MPPFQVRRTDLPATVGPQSWLEKIQDLYTNALEGFPPAEILKSLMGRPGDPPQVPIPLTTMIPGGIAPKVATAVADSAEELVPRARQFMKAYHGSGADFNKYDPKFIGTGEGGAAFGPGHYFAEKEDVAQYYRDAVGGWGIKDKTGKIIVPEEGEPAQTALNHLRDAVNAEQGSTPATNPSAIHYQQARKDLAETAHFLGERGAYGDTFNENHFQNALQALDEWEKANLLPERAGHMYEVKLHADPSQFLDWGNPISANPEVVQKALGYNPTAEAKTAELFDTVKALRAQRTHMFETQGKDMSAWHPDSWKAYAQNVLDEQKAQEKLTALNTQRGNATGKEAWQRLTEQFPSELEAAEHLRQKGIAGIRYFDRMSRDRAQGTYNHVIFPGNEHLIEIARKYGIPLALLPTLFGQGQDTNAAQ